MQVSTGTSDASLISIMKDQILVEDLVITQRAIHFDGFWNIPCGGCQQTNAGDFIPGASLDCNDQSAYKQKRVSSCATINGPLRAKLITIMKDQMESWKLVHHIRAIRCDGFWNIPCGDSQQPIAGD